MNAILKELGFQDNARVAVVHADDIGMFPSSLMVLEDLLALGIVTSASAMVPCRGFADVAAWHQQHPEIDLGIHLTLTSEWKRYRWQPISSGTNGLVDKDGYMHSTCLALGNHASSSAVRAEMHAQIHRAEQLGLIPTHLDTHMGAALSELFLKDYLQLGLKLGLPVFLPRLFGHTAWQQEIICKYAGGWEALGMPVFDYYASVSLRSHIKERKTLVRKIFANLPTGLSCIALHPAADTPELRQICKDWPSRVVDFETFCDPQLRDDIHSLGIQLISYRTLTDGISILSRKHRR